jgi:hypothetical protein
MAETLALFFHTLVPVPFLSLLALTLLLLLLLPEPKTEVHERRTA